MRAAIYEKTGAARDVISIVDMETPQAGPGEVRVQLHTSGVNPSDVKSRSGATGSTSMDLERSVESSERHCRRVCCVAGFTSCSLARQRRYAHRCLSWYSSDDRSAYLTGLRWGFRSTCTGSRWRRSGGTLCNTDGSFVGCPPGTHNCQWRT